MISETIVVGVILILIVLNIVYLQKQRKNNSKKNDDSVRGESSKLILGDEYLSGKEKKVLHSDTHVITIIYHDKERDGVWLCPNCEAENAVSFSRCSVCNQKK